MKDKYTIEITLKQSLAESFYKDCGSMKAFKKWLGVMMMTRQKLASETFYLPTLNSVTCFCLS